MCHLSRFICHIFFIVKLFGAVTLGLHRDAANIGWSLCPSRCQSRAYLELVLLSSLVSLVSPGSAWHWAISSLWLFSLAMSWVLTWLSSLIWGCLFLCLQLSSYFFVGLAGVYRSGVVGAGLPVGLVFWEKAHCRHCLHPGVGWPGLGGWDGIGCKRGHLGCVGRIPVVTDHTALRCAKLRCHLLGAGLGCWLGLVLAFALGLALSRLSSSGSSAAWGDPTIYLGLGLGVAHCGLDHLHDFVHQLLVFQGQLNNFLSVIDGCWSQIGRRVIVCFVFAIYIYIWGLANWNTFSGVRNHNITGYTS